MVRYNDEAFLRKAESFALLGNRHHRIGFTGSHDMTKQFVTTIEATRDCVKLMLTEPNLRVDAHKVEMAAVVFARSDGVELDVIQAAKLLTALRICPNPVRERLLDQLLLALRDGRILFVQNRDFVTFRVLNVVNDTHIFEVERLLDNLVAVDPIRSVGAVGLDVALVIGFAVDAPLSGVGGVVDMDVPLTITGCVKQLKNELLDDIRGYPCSTQTDGDFACRQVLRLYLCQSFNICNILFRI